MALQLAREPGTVEEHLKEPHSIAETGLDLALLADLVLKVIYFNAGITAQAISDAICLPYRHILDQALATLKRDELVEVRGSNGLGELSYQYALSLKGVNRAREVLAHSSYVGPAPVTLQAYQQLVVAQAIGQMRVTPALVRQALCDLVLDDFMLDSIGQAVNSGRSLFLYGPPGNGKTRLAEHVARLLGDPIYIPHAIIVDGQIMTVFDSHHHVPVQQASRVTPLRSHDQRWVFCERPVVIVGGELTLSSLDLIYDEVSRFYQAPLQVKANGGLFLIDDFGRQQVSPQQLLNRWIVPLENRIDFLTLHTGKKLEVPFDQLIVFSTNLAPASLVDEAFLRRIQSKIHVGNPTVEQYCEIFRRECATLGVPFSQDGLLYLLREYYVKPKRELRRCHPRDLLRQLLGITRYKGIAPAITPELLDLACHTYFADM